MANVEAGVDVLGALEAAHQDAGAGEQQHADSDLNGEENAAQRQARVSEMGVALQRGCDAAGCCVQCRSEAEGETGEQCDGKRVGKHTEVGRDAQGPVRREAAENSGGGEKSHRQGDGRGTEREKEAFDEQLADESRAAAAEGETNRDFAAARRGAREEEIADVRARQKEHQRDGGKQERDARDGLRLFARAGDPRGAGEDDSRWYRG